MPIDRRTFMLGGGVASTLGAFASFGAVATVEPGARALTPVVAAGAPPVAPAASYQLRILGWDRSDDHPTLADGATGWIAIDSQWRGAWR
jgi:hypothetical protein